MFLHLLAFFVLNFIHVTHVQCRDRPYFDPPDPDDAYEDSDTGSDSTETRVRCKETVFYYLSKYRRFSNTPENWEDANACCIMRGMVLHTIERADEEAKLRDTLKILENTLGTDNDKPYWTSAKWNESANDYTWFYGKPAGNDAMKEKYQREWHIWKPGQERVPNEGHECVAIEHSYDGKPGQVIPVQLSKRNCEEKRHYICQTPEQHGGHDLNQIEVDTCRSFTIADYHELPNKMYLKLGRYRWKTARLCCEMLNMTLLGSFMEEEKHKTLWNAMTNLLHSNQLSGFRFWTSLNNHCTGDWEWMCGQREDTIPWRDANPDNYKGFEDCGEFKWLSTDKKNMFLANDLTCDFSNPFICEKKAACPLRDRWKCDRPPRIIDITEPPPLIKLCFDMKIFPIGNTSDFMYFIFDKKMTWLQARFCLQILNYTQASFQTKEDMYFFTKWMDPESEFEPEYEYKYNKTVIWTTATTYEKSITTNLTWPDLTYVDPKYMHKFYTHDYITPICGKLIRYEERVAVMTENCVELLYLVGKIPIVTIPPDPFQINRTTTVSPPCATQALGIDLTKECPESETTIQRPNASQIQLTKAQMTEEELHKLRFQNRKLLETVVSIGTVGNPFLSHNHKPKYGFRLYGMAAAVYVGQCPDVPRSFIEDSLYYFHRIHYYTSQARTELLDTAQYSWIKKLMEQCITANLTSFRTDECGEWVITTDNCTTNFICPDPRFQFNITKYDPLVEIWWKIFELSHAVCFQFFHESYRMFHLYSKAIMDLFSSAMRLRMEHQVEPSKFWERVLGPQYELYLINMDRCNEAVIKRSSLPYRLHYSTLPARVRLLGATGNPLPKFPSKNVDKQ